MPRTSRSISVHPVSLRKAAVVEISDLTSGMRRITLSGDEFRPFVSSTGVPQPAFDSTGFDDDVRLFFAAPGEAEPVLPIQREGHLERPSDPGPLSRVYTVRGWDESSTRLDIDFVRHGTGIATTWAYRAQVGDVIHLAGPRVSRSLPTGVDWLLIVGDDTALPAIARLLEQVDAGVRAQVVIEIADASHRQQLRELPGVDVQWVIRETSSESRLLESVRSLRWKEGKAFAWVAGEQSAVRDIRRHLVEDRQMPKASIDFTGYWRRSEVVPMATDESLPDPARSALAYERFHDLAEIVPAVAIRVAVELGVGDLISRGLNGVEALADRTGSDVRALGKLLRYLCAIDLLREAAPGRFDLTEVGEFLTHDMWIDRLSRSGVLGRQSLGIYGLAESVRTGRASFASVTGEEFSAVRAQQDYEDQLLDRVAGFQSTLAQPIADSDLLDRVSHLVIHSGGAGSQARAFLAAHPELKITICALPAQADWLRRDLPESIPDRHQRDRVAVVEQSIFEPIDGADAAFIIRSLASLPDADAAYALRRVAENLTGDRRLFVIEDTFDTEKTDEHDGEADLLALTLHGTGLRTEPELIDIFAVAGLSLSATHALGWGTIIYELAPLSPKRSTAINTETRNPT